MDKINVAGYDWVRLNDVCDILRSVQKNNFHEQTQEVIREIALLMFYDERKAAKTDEEREAAIELPGEFVVCKKIAKRKLEFFVEWQDGEAVTSPSGDMAMIFKYEGMADQIAEKLGEGWQSVCVGVEDGKIVRRIMDALFGEEEGENENVES